MDVSKTATISRRSHGRHGAMRELQTQLAAECNSPIEPEEQSTPQAATSTSTTAATEKDKEDDVHSLSSEDSSDVEDIDRGTAIITVYNLLSNLGDLNQSNRWVAEGLAQKFSSLQMQVDRTESLVSEESLRRRSNIPSPINGQNIANQSTHYSSTSRTASTYSESTFHTPPVSASAMSPVDNREYDEKQVQTDLDISELSSRAQKLAEENKMLRNDVKMLIESLREQHKMARDYESTLARALGALRLAAFERHGEIKEIQRKYQELLGSEKTLNERLELENSDLRGALSNAANVIRATLAMTPDDNSNDTECNGLIT
ncbi:hypothetical protein J3B02_006465 [Coemansia erecta]|uniref:Uncharacterized protein n=1 Tax=Coemansia asiatica TaxID=1052880 RepID=A0A9W7XHP6_9FUNG|nr:hypothetical protein LPJ64_004548 [Coemansia asiatica]KAJ2836867.1 hypothetical protein J3B02_006465 [Coemansia erecta]KAJ2879757.1 hypothetical protein FB639_003006 [Coemansia asiatica]